MRRGQKINKAYFSWKQTVLQVFGLTLFLYVIVINQPKTSIEPSALIVQEQSQPFQYNVYCPIKANTDVQFTEYITYLNVTDLSTINKIFSQLNETQTYIVYARAMQINPILLSYCGSARLWNQSNCNNAKFVCTIPGPTFYIPVDQQITIIWVNQINGTGLNWTTNDDSCYNSDNTMDGCYLDAKNASNDDCTYFSPYNYGYNGTKKVRTSMNSVPISPHIHGLQSRPAFDGHPYNWFNNVGDKGLGYQSVATNNYFKYFNQSLTFLEGLLNTKQQSMFKVNMHKNHQIPALSFYHDHTMRATLSNVVKGMTGMYILYDEKLEAGYPKGNEQILFVFHFHNQGDIRNHTKIKYFGGPQQFYVSPLSDKTFNSVNDNNFLYRNMTYRFRFLNAHYDTTYKNISFVVFYKQFTNYNGSVSYIQTFPFQTIQQQQLNQNAQKLQADMHKINMTIIGADSALFNSVIQGINQFQLSPAQRLDILIKFEGIPQSIGNVYIFCQEDYQQVSYFSIKQNFTLKPNIVNNKYKDPSAFSSIQLPYSNLSDIPTSNISNIRMRALISRPVQGLYSINMHPFMNLAAAQNPKIGTIQDWYIVNTVYDIHPIHIHLINFQVVKQYSLKVIDAGCSFYELDFFRESNVTQFQIDDDISLCNYLNNITLDQIGPDFSKFSDSYLQNQFINTDIGLVSGKNVMQKISNSLQISKYSVNSSCSLGNIYKYICEDSTSDIFPWYGRWKDTAGIMSMSVSVLRIRWTKTTYDDSTLQTYPYFNYDEDTLTQFPGFVYHCHLLIHQDNMMMRPIVVTHSDYYLNLLQNTSQNNVCSLSTWNQSYQCLNQKMNCSNS